MKNNNKQIIIAILIILVLFVVSIFFVDYLRKGFVTKNNISVNYKSSTNIKINNKLPISDSLGKVIDSSDEKQGYLVFDIKNKSNNKVTYDVYITENKKEYNWIKGNYIKFYLTDENDRSMSGFDKNSLPTFSELTYLNDKPSSRLLYRGKLGANETENLKLRVWISDSYALSDIEEVFSFEVSVREK